jgi:two-component system, LytTR family, sensor kinase
MKWPPLRAIARAYLMAIAFWYGFALLMGLQYTPLNRQHLWSSLVDLMAGAALRGFALAFWTPPIFFLVGRYLGSAGRRFRYVSFWSLGAAPFVLLHTTLLWILIRPYDDSLQKYLPRSFQWWVEMIRNGFADQIFIYAAIVVAAHAYNYLKRLQREERERYEYQQALASSQLQALKTQLHPHFLFNTLHGIATLVDTDAKLAKAMIIKLSSLLRKALDANSADLIPLEDEMKFVREYLDLEKMRLGSRLRVELPVAPETLRLLVPQMILQPLAENAIRHGVASSREGGWIEIATNVSKGILTVRLRNSVGGKTSNGTGVGLSNAEARLKYLYSGDAGLRFEISEDHVATVLLTLPELRSPHGGVEGGPDQTVLQRENPLCVFSSSTTNP